MEHGDSENDKDQPQVDKTIQTEVEAAATSTAHIGMEFALNHLKQEPGLSQAVNNEPVLLIKEEVLEDSSQDASSPAGTDRVNETCDTSLGDLHNVKQELGDVDIGPVVIQHMDIHYIINKDPSAVIEDNTIVDDCNEAMPGSGVKESRSDKLRGFVTPLKATMECNADWTIQSHQHTVHKEHLQSVCRVHLTRLDTVQCELCGAVYTEKRLLHQHLQSVHGSHPQTSLFVKFRKTNKQQCAAVNKTILCKYCRPTTTKSDYDVKSCLGQQKDLAQHFSLLHQLRHQDRVISSNDFKCDVCSRTFHKPPSLSAQKEVPPRNSNKNSLTTKSVVAALSNQSRNEFVKAKQKPFECDICGKGYCFKAALGFHKRLHSSLGPSGCHIYDAKFSPKSNLRNHLRRHIGKKPCHWCKCDAKSAQSSHLTSHMKVRTVEKPYQCNRCKARYARRKCFIQHMKTHTSKKRYQCKNCDVKFLESSALTKHMRVHTGEKPYPCGTCGAKFAQHSALATHIRVHTGEKPYQRDTCDARFSRSNELDEEEEIDVVSLDDKNDCCVGQSWLGRSPLGLTTNRSVRDPQDLQRTVTTTIGECGVAHKRGVPAVSLLPAPRKRCHSRRGPRTPVSSLRHNEIERQRRLSLKKLFAKLKCEVPSMRKRKSTPNVLILREAAALCRRLAAEERERYTLQRQQARLFARFKMLIVGD